MRFTDPPRRKPPESIVPMINVVFLLLVFFLMTAQIAPPDPFEVSPPRMAQDGPPPEGEFTLHLGPQGELAYSGAVLGQKAALDALLAAKATYCAKQGCHEGATPPPLVLRADASVPAARLAALMPRLGALGFTEVQLVTVTR
ncbi:biopolymer transporter ExbD [Roseovarius sp. A21]|uniref:Biopolymer transporter ExbD n=1 Tax=Roseovarius bejariae TaxID=2576383 RepID=A0A844D1B0_9RHOB|nr:biopolymer transporter ExbD [Roseovarius bejariae]MRU14968.1 biopolymer transporter ExbD [Roseovarius bejariae]